jgi:ArsR family transcriptional regulator
VNPVSHADDVSILAALADPIRLEIVKRLARAREVAGADLATHLGISRALLCHHAGILVSAGVVARRKEGQTGYLSLNTARVRRCLGKLAGPARQAKTRPSRPAVVKTPVRPKLR